MKDGNELRDILIHDLGLQAKGFLDFQVAIDKALTTEKQFETSLQEVSHDDLQRQKSLELDEQITMQLQAQAEATMHLGEMALPLSRGLQEETEKTVHLSAAKKDLILNRAGDDNCSPA